MASSSPGPTPPPPSNPHTRTPCLAAYPQSVRSWQRCGSLLAAHGGSAGDAACRSLWFAGHFPSSSLLPPPASLIWDLFSSYFGEPPDPILPPRRYTVTWCAAAVVMDVGGSAGDDRCASS